MPRFTRCGGPPRRAMLPLAVGKMSPKSARFPLLEQGGHRYPTPSYFTQSSQGTSDSAPSPGSFVRERRQPQEQINPDRAGSPYYIGPPGEAAISSARRPMRRTTTAGTFLAISHRRFANGHLKAWRDRPGHAEARQGVRGFQSRRVLRCRGQEGAGVCRRQRYGEHSAAVVVLS